ncbi:Txe/YoeB family addiction module toxin [Mucilaginibacter rubeus]|uniref:Putative mRNA interferase YoeB n=1 Tax=Mucilaginibacter rubeus TaxID=2027860 RepID=A0AAE6JJ58_9SPHI|nr:MULTISPECIES: Txe/YoeB family addiction module toxin [Mucilaginibacter]QEM06777.1 Txe/YoeB family addiction module toxin [Mucilaginibacter rubeus]QEM19365.1 Txe/YoeB family addiction module toxin [Mucilaginibacter gossypii]QTE44086.1 Txe/YoeB family addiction module toxin [Mucilaginibacter rubeus]QTE50687.1 Txe/YoeB family addiction module toxin [Mucilaginibacter rubeus]QTE55769.1 Txe/YoeB family addiction module toxin [Mucilaginibacter rubeus]
MEIDLYEKAIRDFEYWKKSGNKVVQKKISQIFSDMKAHPFEGIGKPEPLKYRLTGKWLRRINSEHRIIYDVVDETINVYSLRGHYE